MNQALTMLFIPVLVVSALIMGTPEPEKAEYEIFVKGKKIGTLTAVRQSEGNKVIYKNTSLTELHVLKEINVHVEQKAVYQGDVLQFAESKTWVNGHMHDHTTVNHNSGTYEIKSGDDLQRYNGVIKYSGIMLMLKEPTGYSKSYSEHEAEYHELKRIEPHYYEKTSPNGRKNYYRYSNGELQYAKVDAGWYTFTMKRK